MRVEAVNVESSIVHAVASVRTAGYVYVRKAPVPDGGTGPYVRPAGATRSPADGKSLSVTQNECRSQTRLP